MLSSWVSQSMRTRTPTSCRAHTLGGARRGNPQQCPVSRLRVSFASKPGVPRRPGCKTACSRARNRFRSHSNHHSSMVEGSGPVARGLPGDPEDPTRPRGRRGRWGHSGANHPIRAWIAGVNGPSRGLGTPGFGEWGVKPRAGANMKLSLNRVRSSGPSNPTAAGRRREGNSWTHLAEHRAAKPGERGAQGFGRLHPCSV